MIEPMKPILIIPEGTMSPEDIKKLNDNGICTVEAKNPALVKFLDPIPSAAQRSKIEDAAIGLARLLLNVPSGVSYNRNDFARAYVDILVKGTKLNPGPTQEDREQAIFDQAKADELRRLAREEAKEERDRAKAEKGKAAKGKPASPPPSATA